MIVLKILLPIYLVILCTDAQSQIRVPQASHLNSPTYVKELFSQFSSVNLEQVYQILFMDPTDRTTRTGSVAIKDHTGRNTFEHEYEVSLDFIRNEKYAHQHAKIFKNASLASLPAEHFYNYVITKSGEVIYGLVDNSWEFGVKHGSLAGAMDIVVAGELSISKERNIDFNLNSGTFTLIIFKELIKKVPQKEYLSYQEHLEKTVQIFFQQQLEPGARVSIHDSFNYPHPSYIYALEICDEGLQLSPLNFKTCGEIKKDYKTLSRLRSFYKH